MDAPQHVANKCILVVEDDPDVADMLATLLESEGYEAVVADSGLVAINMLAAIGVNAAMRHVGSPARADPPCRAPDLILLDLQLPVMDGAEMVRHLRHMEYHMPPIIVMSAKRREAVDLAAVSIGAAGVVYKPFQIEDLLSTVDRVMAAAIND